MPEVPDWLIYQHLEEKVRKERKATAENTTAVHESALKAARGWRCWDRAGDGASTEDRILDGAVWAVLTAIDEGKIPGIYFKAPSSAVR